MTVDEIKNISSLQKEINVDGTWFMLMLWVKGKGCYTDQRYPMGHYR